jgi:hypothetical protein
LHGVGYNKIMNVLINQDEWLLPWIKESAIDHIGSLINPQWNQTLAYIRSCKKEFKKSGLITIDFRHVNTLLFRDLQDFRDDINREFKIFSTKSRDSIVQQIQGQQVADEDIVTKYLSDTRQSFAKCIGPQLSDAIDWVVDAAQADYSKPFFVRNIVNNESLLERLLKDKLDFWFVDTGYTNFLHTKLKVWHRLVHNGINFDGGLQKYPQDRLHLLSDFPKKWRKKGSKILVIESSPAHYAMRGTTLDRWKHSVLQGLSAVTDRPVEFRHKNTNRKSRESLYSLLKETKEYYCVVSDCSAAAVEALWTGTPVITLETHITNSVSRRRLDQINNLYRGDLENWFAMVSYNQFTFDELCNGTAVALVREYQNA